MGIRITTWNVNGIRNPFGYQPWRDRRTFQGMFDLLEADIVIMQELKIQRKDLRDDMVLVPGWDCYFSLPKHKKGYSGVGIYTRQTVCAPIRAEEGVLGVLSPPNSSTPYCELPEGQCIGGYLSPAQIADLGVDPAALDAEGRCVIIEFPAFVLLGVYSPANSSGTRDDFRHGFILALDARIRNLDAMGKRVVLTGDLNVSRDSIDTANAEEDIKKMGITYDDYVSTPNRRIFNQLLEGGKVVGERDEGREKPVLWDICRGFHPGRARMFTHWEQKINARPANYGSRIDYVLCSISMKDWCEDSNIQEGLMGSDHCPVYATLKDKVSINGKETTMLDIMNPPGTFRNGKRLKEWALKDVPALSGKLLPEFDRRRNIKDMFARKPSLVASQSTVEPPATPPATLSFEDEKSDKSTTTSLPENGVDPSPKPTRETSIDPTTTVIPTAPSSPEKKRAAASPVKAGPAKRNKSAVVTNTTSSSGKGQQSLRGFFKTKSIDPTPSNAPVAAETNGPINGSSEAASDPETGITKSAAPDTIAPTTPAPQKAELPGSPDQPEFMSAKGVVDSPSKHSESSEIIDPIVSKESWSKLFTKPAAPRCEGHDEPCISLLTKKSGFNCGRSFWICPRPVGPSGNKEKGTQWRCHTFIWASDWNGNT